VLRKRLLKQSNDTDIPPAKSADERTDQKKIYSYGFVDPEFSLILLFFCISCLIYKFVYKTSLFSIKCFIAYSNYVINNLLSQCGDYTLQI
jgi:hypothetical protein